MTTYRDIDRADQAHRSALHGKALTAEMALVLVDGLRDHMRCPEGALVLAKRAEADEHSNEVNAHLLLDGDTVRCRLVLRFTEKPHDPFTFNLAVTQTTAGTYRAEFIGPDYSHVNVVAEVSRKDGAALATLFAKVADAILSFVRTAED